MKDFKTTILTTLYFWFLLSMQFFFNLSLAWGQDTTKAEILEKLKKYGIEAYEVQFNPDEMYAFKSFSIKGGFFHLKLFDGYLIPGKTDKGVTVLIFPNSGKLSVDAKDELGEKVKEDFGKAKFDIAINNAYVRLNPQDYSEIIGDNELVRAKNEAEFNKAMELNDKKFRWYFHAWHLATFPPEGTVVFNLESAEFEYIELFKGKSPSLTWFLNRERVQKEWPVYVSKYFRIHFPEDSPIRANIDDFANERDRAYEKIVEVLQIDFKDTIDLYVYNSRKQGDRLRIALNFASPEERQVHCALRGSFDHEITHVVAYYIGDYRTQYGPLVEGLSEYLGKPNVNFNAIAAGHLRNGNLIPLWTLFDNWSEQNGILSYPQSGSLVKFLIEEYSLEKFKSLWTSKKKIDVSLSQIYGLSLATIERQWVERLKLVKPAAFSPKEEILLKSFVHQLDNILGRRDKLALKSLVSHDIGEEIAHVTEVNVEKIFALSPTRVRGTIMGVSMGSGSLVSAQVTLEIKCKDKVQKAKVEYIIVLNDSKCKLWQIRNFELLPE